MKVYIGADHAGFGLKDSVVNMLKDAGHEVMDPDPEGRPRQKAIRGEDAEAEQDRPEPRQHPERLRRYRRAM